MKSLIWAIAEACHEVNRAYCQALGDHSQPSWREAPAWQRQSAVNGVQFHLDHPGSKPSDSHENWRREKVEAGWVYGPVKDPDANPPTHPCLVDYADLPAEQRAKDHLFIAIVRAVEKLFTTWGK